MIKVAIVGAGKAGCALLDIFTMNGEVRTVAITDRNPGAPALGVAKELGIFIAGDLDELCAQKPDIVINVTGQPDVSDLIRTTAPTVDVVDGKAAKFLWGLVQRQNAAKKDMQTLYENGLVLTSAKNLSDVLDTTLNKAMELTEMPAGSIALCERDEMVLTVSRGLRSAVGGSRWKPRPQGLTSYILQRKELVEIADIKGYPFFDHFFVLREDAVEAILAYPLMINGDVVGVIYLDDYKPRTFSDRQKNLIRLFGSQAAQAIEKFRILEELYRVVSDLDATTAYFRNVLDDSQDMIATTDNEGRIVEFSKGGERILGFSRDEIIGRKASEFYVDEGERENVIETLRARGAVYNYETRLRKKDGSLVDISLTISRLRSKTGRVIGTVGVSKDITEEKRLGGELHLRNEELRDLTVRLEDKVIERTRELESANRELTKANQIKARFISNMSHELRTPLNSVLGFSEILLEETFGGLNEKQRRHVSNIYASGQHLLQLIANILDLAKIEAGKVELCCEDFGVREAIDEVVMVMDSLAAKKEITIATNVPAEAHTFNADKVKFKQILYNLLSNAIKFTPEGGKVGINVETVLNRGATLPGALEGQQLLRASVWDRGIGIKDEDRERIFEEFEQVDSSMSRDHQGTGLGLSLTKRLVDLHGGRISCRSVYGEGSEFVFCLPAAVPKKLSAPAAEYKSVPMTFPWISEEASVVLVVEDDLPTSEILTIHLTKAGYRVIHAYDGIEAVSKAREFKPFVVTLDIMLPRKDGWEVLQSLKADPETAHIPVIIHSIIDNRDLAYALGASDYLLKPIDKNVLLGKLSEFSVHARKGPISVLLISGDPATRDHLCGIFSNGVFLFHSASSREEGIGLAVAVKPNMIMIDLGTCGFEEIKELKDNIITADIPIFVLTNKDLSMEERMNLTGQIERILKKDDLLVNDLIMHLKDLEILHPKRAGLIDGLTGLFNHRYFQLRLAQEVSRASRYRMPLSLVLLDVDGFGHYAARRGDYHGNLVLKKIADLLKRNIRGSDIVVRYGGDAFGVILPNTLLSQGLALSRRFNTIIADYPFLSEETQPKGKITVSAGVSSFKNDLAAEVSPEELIKRCEIALAQALRKGGDRVEVFEEIG